MEQALRMALEEMKPIEREEIQRWAKDVQLIRESNLPISVKLLKVKKIETKQKLIFKLILKYKKNSLKNIWKNSGLPVKCAFVGGAVVLAVGIAGSKGSAGIALGKGVAYSVPKWLLGASGGAFIGTLLEELDKIKGFNFD